MYSDAARHVDVHTCDDTQARAATAAVRVTLLYADTTSNNNNNNSSSGRNGGGGGGGYAARRYNNNNNNYSNSNSNNGGAAAATLIGPPYPGVSFAGDRRVWERRTCVQLAGRRVVLVDRAVRANERATVYARNSKAWQHIPLGQACVFVESCGATPLSSPARMHPATSYTTRDSSCSGSGNSTDKDNNSSSYSSYSKTNSYYSSRDGSDSIDNKSSTSNNNCYSSGSSGSSQRETRYVCAAMLSGLRCFGHWNDGMGIVNSNSNSSNSNNNDGSVVDETAAAASLCAVALERVDGEGGEVAAVCIGDARYWLIGCHACHILVRLLVPEADVAAYNVQRDNNDDDDDEDDKMNNDEQQQQRAAASRTLSSPVSSVAPATTAARCVTLAQHIARAWRRVLQHCGRLSHTTTTATTEAKAKMTAAAEALHAEMVARQCTLCFSAIVQGYEQLVDYWDTPHDDDEDDDEDSKNAEATRSPLPWWLQQQQQQQQQPQDSRAVCAYARAQPSLLRFFAVTTQSSNNNNNSNSGSLCLPPRDAFALFARHGLPVVRVYTSCAADDNDEKQAQQQQHEQQQRHSDNGVADDDGGVDVRSAAYALLRQRVASAVCGDGAVCYGSDGGGRVVRMWKCCCYAHMLERAAQEGIVTHRLHGRALASRLQKKHAGLPRDVRACAAAWLAQRLPWLTAFSSWLHTSRLLTPTTSVAVLREMRAYWVTLQRVYAAAAAEGSRAVRMSRQRPCHGGSSGGVVVVEDDKDTDDDSDDYIAGGHGGNGNASTLHSNNNNNSHADNDDNVDNDDDGDEDEGAATDVILLAGPQGCGKSTLARALCVLLEQHGCTPRWVNQDEYGNRRAYLAAIARAARDEHATHILLDKMNLNDTMRADYETLQLKVVLSVAWSHAHGAEALTRVCVERVRRRGAHHRSLCVASPSASPAASSASSSSSSLLSSRGVEAIVRRCVAQYEPPCDSSVLMLDVGLPADAVLTAVWSRLRERGLYELPAPTAHDMACALCVASEFERLLTVYPRRVRAVVLRACDARAVRAHVATAIATAQQQQRPQEACMRVHDASHDVHILTSRRGNAPAMDRRHRNGNDDDDGDGDGDDKDEDEDESDVCAVLHDFVQKPCAVAFVHYAALIGRVVRVQLRRVVCDGQATVLLLLCGDAVLDEDASSTRTGDDDVTATTMMTAAASSSSAAAATKDSAHMHSRSVPLRSHSCGRGYRVHAATTATAAVTAAAPRHDTESSNDNAADGGGGGGDDVEEADVVYAVLAQGRRVDAQYCDTLAHMHHNTTRYSSSGSHDVGGDSNSSAVTAASSSSSSSSWLCLPPSTCATFRYEFV